MKLKKILMIGWLFLLCGCTCEYDLKIEGTTYKESFSLFEEESDNNNKSYLNSLFLEEYPIFYSQEFLYYAPTSKKEENSYYIKSIDVVNNLLNAKYDAVFDNDSYSDSRAIKTAFKNVNVGYDAYGKYYYIDLSDLIIFKADNKINNIKINISVDSNYVVIYNNATNVNGNTYFWEFNSEEAELVLRYQTKENNQENTNPINNKEPKKEEKDSKSSEHVGLLILGSFAILIIVISLIAIFNKKKF